MAGFLGHLKTVRQAFNLRLGLSCALIAFSQVNFGFDQVAFSTTQAMDSFGRKFGVYNPVTDEWALDPVYLSIFNALPYLGFFSGVFIGSSVSARYGRRMVMFSMSLWALVTVPIVITANSRSQMLAGRVLNYIYLGMELSVVPVFQSEIVPRQVRGLVVATYQGSIYVGGVIMSVICDGTNKLEGDKQWQIPLGIFAVVPGIVTVLIWFIPESPRWLLLQDRPEDSLKALKLLRVGSFTEQEIEHEFQALTSILMQRTKKATFMDLFRGTNLKRTGISVGMNVFLQITGQILTARYGTVYIRQLGTVDPFVMTIVNQAVNMLGIIFSMTLVDYLGRRPLLYFSGFIQAATWYTMAGLASPRGANTNLSLKTGIVALISVYNFGFCSGWAPLSHSVSAEVPGSELRDYTWRVANGANILLQLTTALVIPYLFNAQYANLGFKVGYIFGSISVVAIIFTYFCVPECKGKSLEHLDILFAQGTPVRKFGTTSVSELSEHGSSDLKEQDTVSHIEKGV